MNRFTLLLLATAAIPGQALAWEHIGHVWDYDDMPIEYWVSVQGVSENDLGPLPGYDETEPEAVDPDNVPYPHEDAYYTVQSAENGYAAWEIAECADFTHKFAGILEDNILESTNFKRDGLNTITFDDPHNDIGEPGTIAATLVTDADDSTVINGVSYEFAKDVDIIFNDNQTLWSNAEINAGACTGGAAMQATMTHEIGHLLGLGHSCEEEDICSDPLLLEATMNWTGGDCNVGRSIPKIDDIESLTSLYGPFASFECSHEADPGNPNTTATGVVPFNLNCTMQSDVAEEITTASWNWGDGGTSTDFPFATHRYETEGNYTIRVCFEGVRASCGDWEYCYRRTGYVRACDVPTAAFTYEAVEGLTYRLLNETNIAVYGCIYDIQWDIYAGESSDGEPISSLSAWEPLFTFDEPGTYTVVQNVGGPAGTGAATLTFNVVRVAANSGCSAVSITGVASGGMLFLAGLIGLMRRRD